MRHESIRAAVHLLAAVVVFGCSQRPDSTDVASGHFDPAAKFAPSNPPTETAPRVERVRVVPGELLVKFRPAATKASIAATFRKVAFKSTHAYRSVPGLQLLKVAPEADAQAVRATLEQQADVEYVEPNFIVTAYAIPNDPRFGDQWALHNTGQFGFPPGHDIDAPAAWDITTGRDDVVIAVIDTGTDYNHEDLAANMFRNADECDADGVDDDANGYVDDCFGIDTANDDADPMDDRDHGTHVAGTIGAAGNNGIGVTGVAWTVRILPCKFLDEEGSGATSDAITCLDYIAALHDRGVNIIASNNSWGGGGDSRALADAIVAQRQRGILFIAAAGNETNDNDVLPVFPCAYDLANVICVAASDPGDLRAFFSNYGTGSVHLGAPGVSIWNIVRNNEYNAFDGTSMATPHVSGVVALLKAQDMARDWRALRNLVLAGAETVTTIIAEQTMTGRRLNAAGSLTCTNSVVLARMRPPVFEELVRPIGGSVALKALHINCALPNGTVNVSVAPSGEIVTLVDNGTGVDEVAGDGIYGGEWIASAPGSFTLSFPAPETEVVTVSVDPLLKAGFPKRVMMIDDFGAISSAPDGLLAGNVDDDPELEILTTGYIGGPLYAWNHDGTDVPGWPVFDVFAPAHASLGEFDGHPLHREIASMSGFTGMRLYSGEGTPLPGWPQFSVAIIAPATIDLDADGLDEIIGYPARRVDGSPVDPAGQFPVLPASPASFVGGAAVADLDGDGLMEVIVADNEVITASNVRGLLPGFPADARLFQNVGQPHPVVGDVDADGKPEIIVATGSFNSGFASLRVRVFSNTGILERTLSADSPIGWPQVALADLDGDGIPEIISGDSAQLHAWKGDGSVVPGWPASLGSDGFGGVGNAVVGDIDGDGQPDVVALTGFNTATGPPFRHGLLQAFDRFGNPLAGFPRLTPPHIGGTTPVIADIDLDGRNDLIMALTPEVGEREGVFAYDLRGAGPYGPIEWGQYQEGPSHRGYYELGKNLPNHAFLTVQAHGAGTVQRAPVDGRARRQRQRQRRLHSGWHQLRCGLFGGVPAERGRESVPDARSRLVSSELVQRL